MPTLTFTLSAQDLSDLVDYLCLKFGYQDKIWSSGSLITNPETKNQFARRLQGQEWIDGVRNMKLNIARQAVANPAPITIT